METVMEKPAASVLLEIFLFLNSNIPAQRSCREVSQSWNEIISTSPCLNSNIAYVIDGNFNSVEPLLNTKCGWPTVRFSGCFRMAHMMSYIPAAILSKLTTIDANECVINKKCLAQIFAITSLIDLRLNYCHLENSIFQEKTPEPLEIQSVNIRSLTILMGDRDIAYLAEHLLPHLKYLVSFTIKEMSSYSILQKLKPYQRNDDFYGFPDSELNQVAEDNQNTTGDNPDSLNNDSETELDLEHEFQPFLFGLNQLHQLVNLVQMNPILEIFPLPMIQQNIDIGIGTIEQPAGPDLLHNQIQQNHELEALVQDDFIENPGHLHVIELEVFNALMNLQGAMDDEEEDEINDDDDDDQNVEIVGENGQVQEIQGGNVQDEEIQVANGDAQDIEDGNNQDEEIQGAIVQDIEDANNQDVEIQGAIVQDIEDANNQDEEIQGGNIQDDEIQSAIGKAQNIKDANNQKEEIPGANGEVQDIEDVNSQGEEIQGGNIQDDEIQGAIGKAQDIEDVNNQDEEIQGTNGDAQDIEDASNQEEKLEEAIGEINDGENIQIDVNNAVDAPYDEMNLAVMNEVNDVIDGLVERIGTLKITTVNSQETQPKTVILDSTIQKLLDMIKINARTLEKINLSFRRSMHAWNIQLFTHVVPTFVENQLQLRSLVLNSFNIPMRNIFIPESPTTSFPGSFGEYVALNLKQLLQSQTKLKKLTLGLRQLLPAVQLEILKEVPPTVEILTIWPVDDPTHDNLLGRFPNLKELRVPQDSTQMVFPTGGLILGVNGGDQIPEIGIHSLVHNLVRRAEQLPNLTSFKGHVLYPTSNVFQDFSTVVINLTELRLKCSYFSDAHLQLLIQNLIKLRHLELSSIHISDAGLSGFIPGEMHQVKALNNYPQILDSRVFIASGLALSNLKSLEEVKLNGADISDFGIYYGLKGLQLRVLDLDIRQMRLSITDWGLNILASQAIDLQVVQLHLGWNATDEGVQNFVSSLKSLDRLNSKINHESHNNIFNYRKAKDLNRYHGQIFFDDD